MDFSKYGLPSKEWLSYVSDNPAAAQDGLSGNDPLKASDTREAVTAARESASSRLIIESGLSEKVELRTFSIPSRDGLSIPLRWFSPRRDERENAARKCLLYFHGGGFLFGSETSDDYLCSNIVETLGIVVLSVIYRHTPAWVHPTQHHDAQDAVSYIKNNAHSLGIDLKAGLSVMGISAGAGLAAASVLRDLEASKRATMPPLIRGAVLVVPWLIHVENYPLQLFSSPDASAKVQCYNAPVIPWPRLKMFSDLLGSGGNDKDPLLNTALTPASKLQGWPKTGIMVAGMDPLRDDGLLFAKSLEELK
jgi:acetyl esterase/lipase